MEQRTYDADDVILKEDDTSDSQNLTGGADVKSEPDDLRLTLLPASELLNSHLPKEGISVSKIPFSVGRLPVADESEPFAPVDLKLPDSRPFRLSRQHFALDWRQQGYGVLDLRSTLGTELNGEFLGHHFGKDFEYLKLGENTITAGGDGSPFTFTVLLEQL